MHEAISNVYLYGPPLYARRERHEGMYIELRETRQKTCVQPSRAIIRSYLTIRTHHTQHSEQKDSVENIFSLNQKQSKRKIKKDDVKIYVPTKIFK